MVHVVLNRYGNSQSKEVVMPLLELVILLIVVGVLLWLVNTYIPMDATIKRILNIVVLIVVVLWLLHLFGMFDSFSNFRVGSHH